MPISAVRKTSMSPSQNQTDHIPVTLNRPAVPQIPIVFIGTPTFAATLLRGMLDAGYRVVGVVTRPDKPSGRNQEMLVSPVKQVTTEHNLPCLQPDKLDPATLEKIADWKPDLIVVAAYGKILPEALLQLPGLGCLNVHASLLPRWRGASPIQNALMNGDTVTGITLIQMDRGVDTGDIIAERSLVITPDETAGVLSERLADLGRALLVETLPDWIKRRITPQPQNHAEATLCQLIEREDGRVFWDMPAEEIYNSYRGLSPWPGIFTYWKRGDDLLRLKLISISFQKTSPATDVPLGSVFELGEKIGVRSGAGVVFLETVQLEGKSALSIRDFLNGNPDLVGACLA